MSDFSERIARLPPKRLALLALELQKRLEAYEDVRPEPIAIVGMGCRFPGGADSPAAFWRLLREGRDASRDVPADRWDADALYDADPAAPGKMYVKRGNFLDGIDRFDAGFFGIAPREAVSLDPQQRILLEVSWEALEDAGIAADSLMGSPAGVFIGACHMDYLELFEDFRLIDAYTATGSSLSLAAGRLSYLLGVQGPALTVDTACSSSLVALHLACQSLRAGECNLAFAGGTNLVVTPKTSVALCELRALSPDGRCKTFDASADGYGRGEGCGVVVLKRLSDARQAGDRILAIVRGSAVNQDGRSGGLTAPNGPAQEAVLRQALKAASVEPASVGYAEAHGTGTSLGDPIEVQALAAVYGQGRAKEKPLLVGSVKTNVGHLEAAAGAAGLIKVILALMHREIPPHLHLKKPNPYIPWDTLPIAVPVEPQPWNEGPRFGAVSSFGFSGTNAHIIIEEAPPPETVPPSPRPMHLLPLSAQTPEALKQLAGRFAEHLAANPGAALEDVCHTATIGRAHMTHRLAVTGSGAAEVRESLAAFASGKAPAAVQAGEKERGGRAKIAFLFTGQGSQYAGMARQLYETSPTFHEALDRCASILQPHLARPLLEIIHPSDKGMSLLDQTQYTQPALFATEYSLAALWQSWGVKPDALLGHSLGEYVAACVAGVLSLEDALALVAARAKLMQAQPPGGAMAAVFADVKRVEGILRPFTERLSIAAHNGPALTVISGEQKALEEVLGRLEREGVRAERLRVSHAFHSPLMEPVLEPFRRAAQAVAHAAPRIPIASNLTGRLEQGADVFGADYWCRHMRQPVSFTTGMEALKQAGIDVFLEIGPSPVLLGMGRRCLPDHQAAWLPSLRPGRGDWLQLLESLAALYAHGGDIDWNDFGKDHPRPRVSLPAYPFQRERYWAETTPSWSSATRIVSAAAPGEKIHLALGRRLRSPLRDVQFESVLSVTTRPSLADHRVYHTVVVPASWHVALLLTAAAETRGPGMHCLEDVAFPEAIVLPREEGRTVQLVLSPSEDRTNCQVLSLRAEQQEWATHATASLTSAPAGSSPNLEELRRRLAGERDIEAFYRMVWDGGIQLDARFRWVEQLWAGEREAVCRMRGPRSGDDEAYALPPGLIDSCFQLVAAAIPGAGQDATAYVPFGIDRMAFAGRSSARLWAHAVLRPAGAAGQEIHTADVVLFEENGRLIASFEGLHLKRAERQALLRGIHGQKKAVVYELAWQPLVQGREDGVTGPWVILGGEDKLGGVLAEALRQAGETVHLLPALPAVPRDVRGIVFLPGLDLSIPDGRETAITAQALTLLQLVVRSASGPLPRVVLVTRGAQAASHPAQALLWGLARTVPLEHPDLTCLCADLDPAAGDEEQVQELLAAMRINGREDQVVFRGGDCLVPRLVPQPDSAGNSLTIHADGRYLITGGLGGLGLRIARWLATQGARHIILLGRREPTAVAIEAIGELEQAGVSVRVIQADAADAQQLSAVLHSTDNLRGVIHAAGILDNAVLLEQDQERLARVLAPKVRGAWNLHELTRDIPLDFFVLFSSVASVLGSPGQANYAAANAFLDALARHRRAIGLPALSVNWGPWAETGMAARVDARQQQRWEAQGVVGIEPDEGLELLGRLLASSATQATVLRVLWPRFLAQFPADRVPPILSELPQHSPTAGASVSDVLRRLEVTPAAERELVLLRHVADETTRVLRLPAGRSADLRQPFSEMGMDSLMAVELRNRLGAAVGRTMPATLVFSFPTVEKLARYLAGEILHLGKKAAAPAAVPAAVNEPIAIVGIGCRLPGARNPGEYWQMLRDGIDAVKEVPADRWDVDAFYDADPEAPGKMYTRRGGFLGNADGFDAAFFGIAPREAVDMDPQQRLLLEVAWEALEDAAIAPESLASTLSAVYVGISTSDYAQLMLKNSGLNGINAYTGTGNAFSVAAGRISYVLGLQGPNFPVDTACSSSLLAVHLACQSLRSGESSLALACGVNLILTPEGHIYFCKLRATSPDGKCKTFDASADGYVRGEGCGVVVLKRLSDALRDGDRIQALVRGSAVNHDGRSNGLTAPNGEAQEAVIRQALASGGVKPEEVGYIEAHGTGTALGDPIEVQALASAFGARRDPLLVGSVKTNIGHLEAGAGVSSLIKVVLALQHQEIPPHLHFKNPNTLIPWNTIPVRVVTERMPWPAGSRKRIAGVSSFGFSGTNVHVLVEEAPPPVPASADENGLNILPLSAATDSALKRLAESWASQFESDPSISLADAAFTARLGRAMLPHRLALLATTSREAREKLARFTAGGQTDGLWSGEAANGMGAAPPALPASEDRPALLEELARRFVHGEIRDWQSHENILSRGRKIALPTYPFERQRFWIELRHEDTERDWLHEIVWQPATAAVSPETYLSGRWLLFTDAEGCGAALARRLEERGAECYQALAGQSWARMEGRRWQLDPANPAEFSRLLDETAGTEPLAGVVFLWGLDSANLDTILRLGCGGLLHLVQALLKHRLTPRLWIVTRDTQAPGNSAAPYQSPLWGLGRVLALEHPVFQSVLTDLDSAGVFDQVDALFEEVAGPDGENQVVRRGKQRLAARLVRSRISLPQTEVACKEDAAYLVTGGTGALGLHTARWLTERGARHIALLSRRGDSALDSAVRRSLEALPGRVRFLQGDAASSEDLRRILGKIERDMPPLRGIIHAAGVLDDGVLAQQDWPRFASVLAPKVTGAWNLHELTKDKPLDFFVLFSSVASLLGSPGQANYAAANAFLDALAHHRHALGLPTLSINWAQWSGAGMAARAGERDQRRLEAKGLRHIDPARGLRTLGRLMASGAVQAGVLPADWNVFFRSLGPAGIPPLLRELAVGRHAIPAKPERERLEKLLQETSANERLARMLEFVASQVLGVMGQPGARDVPAEKPLMELGMDSLMAVELRNVLGRALQVELPATLLFDHPTAAALAGFLARTAFPGLFAPAPQSRGEEQLGLAEEVAGMSEADMEALISEEFSRLKKI